MRLTPISLQILEFCKECFQLGPLYAISQPLAVLKTRILYRTIQIVPPPRIQMFDDNGEEVNKEPSQLQPISWRRIR